MAYRYRVGPGSVVNGSVSIGQSVIIVEVLYWLTSDDRAGSTSDDFRFLKGRAGFANRVYQGSRIALSKLRCARVGVCIKICTFLVVFCIGVAPVKILNPISVVEEDKRF